MLKKEHIGKSEFEIPGIIGVCRRSLCFTLRACVMCVQRMHRFYYTDVILQKNAFGAFSKTPGWVMGSREKPLSKAIAGRAAALALFHERGA